MTSRSDRIEAELRRIVKEIRDAAGWPIAELHPNDFRVLDAEAALALPAEDAPQETTPGTHTCENGVLTVWQCGGFQQDACPVCNDDVVTKRVSHKPGPVAEAR